MDHTVGTPSSHHHHTDPHSDVSQPHVAAVQSVVPGAGHTIQIDENGAVVTLRIRKRSPDDEPHRSDDVQTS